LVAVSYFYRRVPETKNRSLQDIERDLDLDSRDSDSGSGGKAPATAR
jgi:hypothetical protein